MNGIVTTEMIQRGGPRLRDALNNQSFVTHPWQRVLYVQSTHRRATNLNNTGANPDAPLATLVKAISLCTGGEMIVLGPGHAETFSTSNALTIGVEDITIIGMGNGSYRPTFTVGAATTDTITISTAGAGLKWYNCIFAPGIDSLAVGITCNTGVDVLFSGCRFEDTASKQTIKWFTFATGSVRCTIEKCIVKQLTAGATNFAELGGGAGTSELAVLDCDIRGDYSGGCLSVPAAMTHVNIGRNYLHNLNATSNDCVNVGNVAASGYIYQNLCRNQTDADAGWITMGAAALVSLFENYGVNNNQETGKLIGTASV